MCQTVVKDGEGHDSISSETASENAQLIDWSNEEIDIFLPEYFPELDVGTFKDEALAARIHGRDNTTRYMQHKSR
jgi:hypothetical protein